MHRQLIQGFVFFLVLIYCNLAYGQSITVGPDGKFEKQVISEPYAFYNASFGFAGAYAYACLLYTSDAADDTSQE